MTKRIEIAILLLFAVQAIVYSSGTGSSSMATLLIPASSRISALGEACVALENDVALLNGNAAGINGMKGYNTSLMYQRGFADDDYMNVQAGKDWKDWVFATSVLYYSTGDIELFKSDGTPITQIGKRDMILTVGAARKFWRMPVGLSVKYISSELFGKRATAYAFDAGTQYRVSKPVNIGLSVKNVGTKIKYLSAEEPLPTSVQAGGSYTKEYVNSRLLVVDDVAYYVNEKEYWNLAGVELEYLGKYYLRAGYKMNATETNNRSVSMGLGLKLDKYAIDYSTEQNQDLNIPHRLTIGYKF